MSRQHAARFPLALIVSCALTASAAAQETRGTLFGSVRDASGGVLPGMTVVVTNEETNVANEGVTNERGSFEFPYLLPGTYTVALQANGFRKFTRRGVILSVNNRIEVPVILEVGAVTDEVTVTAEASLLETTSSASATLTNRQVNSLPMFGNSALLLARSVPGVQWTGQPNYLGLHSNVGGSAVTAAGATGGNEFSLDGVPNAGPSRRVGYLPYTDTVAEVKIETAGFDASKGHSAGANVSMMTKSGTNQYRGSATWQYWNQDWNATQSTTNAAYYGRIEAAERAGNAAEAQRLRGEPKTPPGHHNNWASVLGGPVVLPRLFDGRSRLFFFFSYNGFKDVKTEEATAVNRTVPTAAHRRGDFSDLLALDPVRYQIYDPRTARLVNGRVVRDPFPNNQVPILNPVYAAYLPFFPMPNNPAGIVGADGSNDYLASATAFNWDYKAFSNRVDWQLTNRHRSFARWSYNAFLEDRGDWTYETLRGLHTNGLVRKNLGGTLDHVFVQNSTTVWNVSVAYNRFTEGNERNAVQLSLSPAAVGLPGYLDERAAQSPCRLLPQLDFNSYSDMGVTCGGFTDYGVGTLRGELSKLMGRHSVRSGVDLRQNWRSNIPGGNTSGRFTFGNNYVRQRDDTNTAGGLGLEWAAFMLGVPTGISIDTNDSYDLTNPFYGAYVQDDWRFNDRLTLNLGLRYEYEGGFVERQNRGVGGGFNFDAVLPIAAAAEAAYARNPLAEKASITVRGGNYYLGTDGAPRELSNAQQGWMPRVGAVYKIDKKTVARGGYGWFYDTNNVLDEALNQFGYSRSTNTILTNDNGLTFLNADLRNGRTIFSDPFPVRADGTRFNVPLGNALGVNALVGRGFTFVDRDWKRARQQRWRAGVQREITRSMVAEVAYLGSYSDHVPRFGGDFITKSLRALPEQYWAVGLARNDAVANYLNALVPNPFNIANFEFLRTQDPVLYQDMANNGFFTSTTIRRHQLLRAYPHMDGLTNGRVSTGESKYHHIEMSLQQRLSHGIEFTIGYTRAWHRDRDFYLNEFDAEPSWRISDASLPHHFMVTAIAELPFGSGKSWLSSPGLGRALLGGWQTSAIYHLQSGRVIGWGNLFYYGANHQDIHLDRGQRDRAHWFNTDLFERASANQPAAFHRRVFPSRLDFIRGDYMNQLDLSLQREVRLAGRTKFQLRVDAINALNNVQWDQPNTTPTSSNFGVVTQQWNTPRWVQFQGRVTF